MDKLKLMQDSVIIAMDLAPQDTGNLKYNAISVMPTPEGFIINYDINIAPYVAWLEDGSNSPHKGFIALTGNAILSQINAELGGIKTNINATRKRVSEGASDNPARLMRFLKNFNGDYLKHEEDL